MILDIDFVRIAKIYGSEAAYILRARMDVIRADRLYKLLRPTYLSTTTYDYIDGYVSTDIAVMLLPVNLWTRNTTLADIVAHASRGKYAGGVMDTVFDLLPLPIAEEIIACIVAKTFNITLGFFHKNSI